MNTFTLIIILCTTPFCEGDMYDDNLLFQHNEVVLGQYDDTTCRKLGDRIDRLGFVWECVSLPDTMHNNLD